MKVFVDANILIDYILKREGFFEDAKKVYEICVKNEAVLAPHTVTNMYYVARKDFSSEERKQMLLEILEHIKIIPIGESEVVAALKSSIDDFEDALQNECAIRANSDVIVTRDVKGFAASPIKALSPIEFIELFENDFQVS
ncbi:PIN domain-containing protein [Bacteroidia bacterium]|nr:PIN domain-containing protein [Bacteroidia bacterium]